MSPKNFNKLFQDFVAKLHYTKSPFQKKFQITLSQCFKDMSYNSLSTSFGFQFSRIDILAELHDAIPEVADICLPFMKFEKPTPHSSHILSDFFMKMKAFVDDLTQPMPAKLEMPVGP